MRAVLYATYKYVQLRYCFALHEIAKSNSAQVSRRAMFGSSALEVQLGVPTSFRYDSYFTSPSDGIIYNRRVVPPCEHCKSLDFILIQCSRAQVSNDMFLFSSGYTNIATIT